MKNRLFLFLLTMTLVFGLIFPASAYTMVCSFHFSHTDFYLGSTGNVTISITSLDEPTQVRHADVMLCFIKADGTIRKEHFGAPYDIPAYIPADSTVNITYSFQIPYDSDIQSGFLYFIGMVSYRQYGHTVYVEYSSELQRAYSGEHVYCSLTNPSRPSYLEVESAYASLQSEYSFFQLLCSSYESSHSYSNIEYEALNSTYGQYMENHSYSNDEYNALQEQYDRDVAMPRNLNYVLATIAVGLAISTVYLAIRKQTHSKE